MCEPRAHTYHVGILQIKLGAADLAGGRHLELRSVGVVHVPHVAAEGHVLEFGVLELEDGVGHCDLGDGGIGVPVDIGCGALDRVAGILEHCDGLDAGHLCAVVSPLACEVLIVDVNGVVLLDEVLHVCAQVGHSLDVVLVLLYLLAVPDGVLCL